VNNKQNVTIYHMTFKTMTMMRWENYTP